ncbi:hypothetical protein AB0O77_25650 [Streptomyces albidoflavus]|uniref:hypothetical protein n=1 Tax=Streptomyces albidoflavus TaxID=1886 RepID=UPI00342FB63B
MGWCDFWEDLPGPPPPACSAKDAAGDAIADAAASAWESVVQDFQSAALYTVKELGLSWLTVDSPVLSTTTGPTGFVIGSTFALTQWMAVLSLLLAAGHMAWTRRADPARQVAAGMMRLAIVSSASVAVVNLLTVAGDGYAGWVVARGLGCTGPAEGKACTDRFVQNLREMTSLAEEDQLALTLVLSLVMLLAGLVQLLMVLVRDSMLIILTGILPLAAAVSSTERGRDWWQRIINALLVALLWAAVAGTIFGAAFVGYGGGNEAAGDELTLMDQLYGAVLMILGALSMPLLWRTMGPVSGALAGAGSGGGGGSGIGRIASGAMMIKGGGIVRGAAGGAKGGGTGSGGSGSGPTGGKTSGSGQGGPGGGASGSGKGGPTGGSGSGGGKGGPTGGPSGGPTGGGPSGGGPSGGGKGGPTGGPSGGPSGGGPGPVPGPRRTPANSNNKKPSGGGPSGNP